MKCSEDVFQLIKSLSKSEKRYFRLFSNLQKGNKNYLLVFDAIDKQKGYDEKQIIRLFREKKIASQFPLVKRYLYNLILSSLESYHSHVESELYSQLNRITILYEKGLYAQCEKIIAKAKQLAMKYDLQFPLTELLKWEVNLISLQSYIGADEDRMREIFNDIFNSIEQYKTTNDYLLHTSLLFMKMMKKGYIRSSSDMKELKMVVDNPLFHVNEQKLSFQSRYRFYASHGVYFSMQNEHEKSYIYYQKQVELWEANPHQIKEYPLKYFHVLNTFFGSNLYLKKYKECAAIIEQLRRLQVKLPTVRNRIDYLLDNMSLALCFETASFKEGLQLIKLIEEKWSQKDADVMAKGELLMFHHNAAYIYFGTGNYHEANKHLNTILNEGIVDTRNDTQCFARIFSLIVHVEMGNQDLLEYRVKSVHRFLYQRKRLYKVEIIILDFISKELPEIHSQKELLKSFEVLLTKMKPLTTDPFERRAFDYFDFVSWLESKTEGRAFAEVVREKCANE